MSTDIGQVLPGLAGPSTGRNRKRSSGLGIYVFVLLLPALAGGAYYGLQKAGLIENWRSALTAPESSDSTTAGNSSTETIASLATTAPRPPEATRETPVNTPVPARPAPREETPVSQPQAVTRTPEQPAAAPQATAAATEQRRSASTAVRTLRSVDTMMQKGELAKARETLEDFVKTHDSRQYLSLAYYRLGSLGRLEKNEDQALAHWRHAYADYPDTVGGRVSAVALADTQYVRYAGKQPDFSKWTQIRDLYSDAIGTDGASFLPQKVRAAVIAKLHRLNDRLIFSPAPVEGALFYTVRPGDYLARIAKEHGVHHDSIMAINNITDARRIRAGQKLKILKTDNVEVIVDKTRLTTTWYLDGKFVREYPCCVGPDNKTPAGSYTVEGKEVQPVWHDPKSGRRVLPSDPDYPLGTRWIPLSEDITTGLGFHGTNEPESIPGRVSNGCIRLRKKDVEELFGFIPLRAKVTIRE